MNFQKVKISEIKPNPNNPRIIKDEKFKKLVKSIQDFPEMLELRPIVVDDNMVVLGGNMRLKALKELKITEVPIIKANELTEDQKKEFIIKDNVWFGEWDWDMLANEWDSDLLNEWGMDVPHVEKLEAVQDDYEVPDAEDISTDIVEWDVFELSGEWIMHKLICGSSTDIKTLEKLFENSVKSQADMVFTDPPYNVDYEGKTAEKLKIQNDKMNTIEFQNFISDTIGSMIAYTKKGWCYYACIPLEVGVTDLFFQKMHLQSVIVWIKNSIVMWRKDYQQKSEPILFCLNDEDDEYEWIIYWWNKWEKHDFYGGRKQSNVWYFDKPTRNWVHPTMKPVELVGRAIKNSSKQWELVLDLFLGSGTTMVASHQLWRSCYGVELDPKYCKVILERMLALDPSIEISRNGEPYTL